MFKAFLPKLSTPKLGTTLLMWILTTIVWFLPDILGMSHADPNYPFVFMDKYVLFTLPTFWAHFIQYVLFILVFYYITRLCETLQIIPIRTMMPLFVGMILFSSISYLQYFSAPSVAFILLVFATAQLVRMYSYKEMVSAAFNIFFLISVASLFVYEYIFFLPIFWIGMIILRSFSFRTLLSSLLGLITPLLLLVSFCFLLDNMSLLDYYWHVPQIIHIGQCPPLTRPDMFYGVALFMLTFWSILSYLFMSYNYKLNVRLNFIFIHWSFWLTLIVVGLFFQHFTVLLYAPMLFIILLLSLYFATKTGKVSSIVFLLFIFFSITYRITSMFGL